MHMHGVQTSKDRLNAPARRALQGGCACFIARKRARRLSRIYDAALAPHGLTSGQFSMLAAVAAAGAMTMRRLAEAMDMDQSTTSRGVAPLTKDGLLSVEADARDARTRVLRLAPAGIERLNAAAETWAGVQAEIARQEDGRQEDGARQASRA
ncbi:MAG: MarR family winged helix-turn-helix transcriptional regulator [Pseudomonadota bacterium]